MSAEWVILLLGILAFLGWVMREWLSHARAQSKQDADSEKEMLATFKSTMSELVGMAKGQHQVIEHMTIGYPPADTKKKIGGETDLPLGGAMEWEATKETLEREEFEKANLEDLRRRMKEDAALSGT